MKKIIALWFIGMLSINFFKLAHAQEFGTLAIPDASVTPHLHLRMGGDLLTFERNSGAIWEQASNLRLKIGLADYVEVGVDVYNAAITNRGVGYSIAFQPLHEENYLPNLIFGIRQISSSEKYVAGLGVPIPSKSNNSVYVATGKTFQMSQEFPTRLILGVGNGYFKSENNGTAEDLQGLFFGVNQNFGIVNLSFEFDGRSHYAGVWVQPLPEVILKLGIRDIDKLDSQEDSFEKNGSFLLGVSYQAPLVPDLLVKKERERYDSLWLQLEDCYTQLDRTDISMSSRERKISELKENLKKEDSELFKRLMQSEAEIYRLREQIKELERKKVGSVDYRKINKSVEHLNNAFLYYYEGKYKQAKSECEKSVKLTPNLGMAHTRLGSIYYRLGDTEKALRSWRRSLEIEPNNPELRETVERIEG
ncbi:MAG: hypothetical protein B6244_05250 [Candidatus Cloacimonetes bacterium 4572_55]|nr:MAG: hypothetical protein B6244_05250 [Candidatus Cloacimonetes bacterium 4572_55]